MNEEMVILIGSEAMRVVLYLAGPLIAAAMAVGLLVSVFQAVTQINESTLTFIPKMAVVVFVLMLMAPWMLEILQNYAKEIFSNLGEWTK